MQRRIGRRRRYLESEADKLDLREVVLGGGPNEGSPARKVLGQPGRREFAQCFTDRRLADAEILGELELQKPNARRLNAVVGNVCVVTHEAGHKQNRCCGSPCLR